MARTGHSAGSRRCNTKQHGTLGVLIRSIRQKRRSRNQVLGLLKDLRRLSTLYVSAKLLSQIIDQVAEAEQ